MEGLLLLFFLVLLDEQERYCNYVGSVKFLVLFVTAVRVSLIKSYRSIQAYRPNLITELKAGGRLAEK